MIGRGDEHRGECAMGRKRLAAAMVLALAARRGRRRRSGSASRGPIRPFSEVPRRRHDRRLRHRHRRGAVRADRRDLHAGADRLGADDPARSRAGTATPSSRRCRTPPSGGRRSPSPSRYYKAPVRFVAPAEGGLDDAPDGDGRQGRRRPARDGEPGLHARALSGDAAPALRQPGARAPRPRRSAGSTRCSARRCSSRRASSTRRPGRASPSSARGHFDPAIQGERRGDRGAQGGRGAARPAERCDRRDPGRRHLRRHRAALLRLRHLRELTAGLNHRLRERCRPLDAGAGTRKARPEKQQGASS